MSSADPSRPPHDGPVDDERCEDNDADDDDLLADGTSHQFTIKSHPQKRLDVYLQKRLKGYSRAKVQQLIDMDAVRVNGRKPKASTNIVHGDVIDLTLPRIAVRTIEPEDIPLDILYEDDHMIVLNKQANIVVHPARSYKSGTLLNALAFHFKKQIEARGETFKSYTTQGVKLGKPRPDKVPGLSSVGATECRPGIVHRLDKNTTGVIVMAKQEQTHWAIAKQFERREPTKAYLAVVHGEMELAGGVIDEPLGKHPTIREAFCIRHDHLGKRSVTLYRVRERYRGYTLVELELKTGRTHQIRVHLQYLGHPIVGDLLYGGEVVGEPELRDPPTAAGARRGHNFARAKEDGLKAEAAADARDDVIMQTPALHAAHLQIRHPGTEALMTFNAPLHHPMTDLVNALRRQPADGPVADSGWYIDLDEAAPRNT